MSDAQLLERFYARRDELAFEAMVTRHGPMVFGVCRRILPDTHDAEDAFQATFLVLVRVAHSRRLSGSLAGWLYRVAHRIAVRASTNAARRRRRERRVARTPAAPPHSHWESEPDLRPVLLEEIARLPEKYRTPVILCYFQGLTEASAAGHMGCPVGTLSGRLCRARDLLRTRLARRGLVLSTGLGGTAFFPEPVSAEVPRALVGSTVKAAAQWAIGNVPLGGLLSASAATLVSQALGVMLMNRLKALAVLGIISVLVTFGAIEVIRASRAADRPAEPNGAAGRQEPARGADRSSPPVPPLPTSPLPTFDGITFERILTGGVDRPLFFDIDTGRYLVPPFGLSPADPGRALFLPNLLLTPQLRKWAQDHGIDILAQTDGRIITLMGFGLQTGDLLPRTTQATSVKPADVLTQVGRSQPQVAADAATFTRVFDRGNFGFDSCLPFVTREGGIGILNVLGFLEVSLRGPNAMQLDYTLVRGVRPPQAGAGNSPRLRTGVPEPMVLGEFAGFLTIDVQDGKLSLRQPGSLERLQVDRDKVVLLSGSTVLLEAARICTGTMDLDARGNRVTVLGRGRSATFSRVGDRVRVEMDGKFAEEAMMRPSLPDLQFFSNVDWKPL